MSEYKLFGWTVAQWARVTALDRYKDSKPLEIKKDWSIRHRHEPQGETQIIGVVPDYNYERAAQIFSELYR